MRVITGTARGRKLNTLQGMAVRPTADRVKEALFSILQFELEGRRILDLFAGSGQLGIEALSRGARAATFVDSDKEAFAVTMENLKLTALSQQAQVLHTDALHFLDASRETFDILFLDPPYGSGLLQTALPKAVRLMAPGGVLVCEHAQEEVLPQEVPPFSISRQYRYGKVWLTLYRREGSLIS